MRIKLLCAMATLGVAIVAFGVAPASAKSFRIAAVQVEATLRADGSMHVVEHITYDFDGEFHNGTRFIPASTDYEIVEMSVRDRDTGVALPFTGAPHQLAWTYDARDERRTFDISYTVLGAADVYDDVAELYWKFVGDEHPGVGAVRVALEVPGDGIDVRAWAHGPLDGLVEPRGSTVLLSVDDLPAGEFVEGRVTVPAGNFTVRTASGDRLPAVLSEEEALASQANEERERRAEAERRRERLLDALETSLPFVVVAGWAVFAVLWARYGREHRLAVDVGDYVREPPDDPPAHVILLREWGKVTPGVLSATIVDLAQRGYLDIEEVRTDRFLLRDKVDWRFTWRQNDAPVRDFEHKILERLFAAGRVTTQSEFEAWCKRHRTTADRWWDGVKAKAVESFRARRYVEGGKGPVFAGNVLAALVVGGLGILAVANGILLGIAALASALVQAIATIALRRRTPAGRQRLAEWDAFERFLRDFSQLEEAPVGHLALWERYLVYAVALGVTAQVARALAAKIPAEVAAQQGFATWYHGSHGGVGALDSIGSLADFSSSFGPTIVAAAQPPSSSSSGSGGGGGFSGGGGGGGGGGSIGAS
ncbi:MAG TPA: DUF2207 domain-containing protein [Acidimicrobiales bacterium]|nr:DUF2207 domain-containing protein [Acidimicrobiales bacterium]